MATVKIDSTKNLNSRPSPNTHRPLSDNSVKLFFKIIL